MVPKRQVRRTVSAGSRIARIIQTLAAVTLLLLAGGCHRCMRPKASTPERDINAVLAAHQDMLLAKPGVVGVCVGLLADGKTQCLKVLLVKKDPVLERSLPKNLEGYPVITEVTGQIRPMAPE